MKRVLIAPLLAIALSLGGCSTFTSVVGEEKSATVRTYAEYVFESFRSAWIPALRVYRMELPLCAPGTPAPCWEPKVYAKLHTATAVAVACMEASTGPGVPLSEIQKCVATVEAAKAIFIQENVAPTEAGQ
jgi:hypothetical protein